MPRNITVVAVLMLLIGSAHSAGPDSSVDWIAGHWCGEFGDKIIQELWLPPHGGVAVGLGRTLSADRTTGFEYFRITEIDGVQSFVAQPGGQPPTVFGRTDGGDRWIRFENPEHDFPQRIEYRRDGDSLHAVAAGPGENGKESVIRFDYRRCDLQESF